MKKSILFLSMLLLFSITTKAQVTVENVPTTADTQINIYIVAQGYTSSSMVDFDAFVVAFKTTLLSTVPFNEFASNIRIVTVKDIATTDGFPRGYNQFNPPYFCGGASGNDALPSETYENYKLRMDAIIQNHIPQYDQKSYLMAIFNNNYYTGGGGKYPFITDYCNSNNYMSRVLIHEFGHTFGLLGDEYADTTASVSPNAFPLFFDRNITQETVREDIPWNYLIANNTAIPTCTFGSPCTSTLPGLYESANYAQTGWYRPQNDCRMRSINQPFCLTCQDLLREMIKKHLCYPIVNVTEDFISRHQDNIHWRKASNILTSNSKIGDKIAANYVSQNAIQLSDGFTAYPGSDFRGYIGDCSSIDIRNNLRPSSSENVDNGFTEYYVDTVIPTLRDESIQTNYLFQIIPNPSNSKITINVNEDSIKNVTIYSTDGKLIYSQNVQNESFCDINISSFSKGIYIVSVQTSNGNIISEKLVKN